MSQLPEWVEQAVEKTETITLHAGENFMVTNQQDEANEMKEEWF